MRTARDRRRQTHVVKLVDVGVLDLRCVSDTVSMGRRTASPGSKRAETHKLPPVLLDVIQVDRVTGEGIPVTCSVDAPPTELLRLLVREVVVVSLIEYSVCVRRVSAKSSGGRGRARDVQAKVEPEPTEKRSPLRRVPSEST